MNFLKQKVKSLSTSTKRAKIHPCDARFQFFLLSLSTALLTKTKWIFLSPIHSSRWHKINRKDIFVFGGVFVFGGFFGFWVFLGGLFCFVLLLFWYNFVLYYFGQFFILLVFWLYIMISYFVFYRGICVSVYIHVFMCESVCVCMCVCVCARGCVCAFVYAWICMCMYLCISSAVSLLLSLLFYLDCLLFCLSPKRMERRHEVERLWN